MPEKGSRIPTTLVLPVVVDCAVDGFLIGLSSTLSEVSHELIHTHIGIHTCTRHSLLIHPILIYTHIYIHTCIHKESGLHTGPGDMCRDGGSRRGVWPKDQEVYRQ